jgi:prepilin-type N-terminal cleavage/methylation domain-containing protein
MPPHSFFINPCRGQRGFSLVEAVMASLIVGVLAVAALQTVGAAVSTRRSNAAMRKGDLFARALLDEVMQTRYAEPCDSPAWGREAGEPAGPRTAWDDVDDYDGLVEPSPTDKDGAALPGSSGWQRSVTVKRLQASDLAVIAALIDTGLKHITVTVRSPDGVTTTLVALRARDGGHDVAVAAGQSCVTWAGASLQVGADGGTVSSGTTLLNRPEP